MTLAPASLSALPISATADLSQNVAMVRDGFLQTLTILDAIRTSKRAFSVPLRTALDSARYSAAVVIARIQQFEGSGGTGAESATTIDGLATLQAQFNAQLANAKKIWAVEVGGVTAKPTWLQRLSTPRSDTSYLLWGMAGLSLYLLYTVTRR